MNSREIMPLIDGIETTVTVPGSKSYTNRALLISAMVKNSVTILEALDSDDTQAMISCLRSLMIEVEVVGERLSVVGHIGNVQPKEYTLNCRLSGTTIRFMTALSCILPGEQILTGGEGLLNRPIEDIVDALRELGAEIEYLGEAGKPPLRVKSSKLIGEKVIIRGDGSSQFISALLMIAPTLDSLQILTAGSVISKPYIDMTLQTMADFGVTIQRDKYQSFSIHKADYRAEEYTVEGDVSSASYFFAAAALTKSKITVKNVNPDSGQADMGFLEILEKSGSKVIRNNSSITVIGHGVKPFVVDMERCPDQAQTLAVLAAIAHGKTVINGIQSLRVKETERVQAIENELNRVGVLTSSTHSTLTIHGGTALGPAKINTYGDHRMAMAFSLLGLKLAGISINAPEAVNKTFPTYWDQFNSLYPSNRKSNIVLIGMRGSGKSHVAEKISKLLNLELLDLDHLLEGRLGTPIVGYVSKYGWQKFREKESDLIEKLSGVTNSVISTGGGSILDPDNTRILQSNGLIFWLSASAKTLEKRIIMSANRPPLTSASSLGEEIQLVLAERKQAYKSAANYTIETDTKTVEEIAHQVLMKLGIRTK